MKKGKIAGIIICSILAIGIIVLLCCNWAGAFAETARASDDFLNEIDTMKMQFFTSWEYGDLINGYIGQIQYPMTAYFYYMERNYTTGLAIGYQRQGEMTPWISIPLNETYYEAGGTIGFTGEKIGRNQAGQFAKLYKSYIYDMTYQARVPQGLVNLYNNFDRNEYSYAFKGAKYAFTVRDYTADKGGVINIDFVIGLRSIVEEEEFTINIVIYIGDNILGTTGNILSTIPSTIIGRWYGEANIPNIPTTFIPEGNYNTYIEILNQKKISQSQGWQLGYEASEEKLKQPLNTAAVILKSVGEAFNFKLFGFLSVFDIIGIALIVGLVFLILNIIRG